MVAASETIYRAARRAFIASCEAAAVDPIARLHPAKDKDGKPLFMDSAALGPRLATRAVLAIADDALGSAIMTALLKQRPVLPQDCRLVLVHALDPAAFAGVKTDPAWPAAMLAAVATEDLSRVRDLAVLPLIDLDSAVQPALAAARPQAMITRLAPAATAEAAQAAIAGFFGR
jgi:hypothetical protein